MSKTNDTSRDELSEDKLNAVSGGSGARLAEGSGGGQKDPVAQMFQQLVQHG